MFASIPIAFRRVVPAADGLVAISVFLLLLLLDRLMYHHSVKEASFFYEYGRVAEAVLAGKGHRDVFGTASGPTAWVLPGFLYLVVLLYWMFGVKTKLALAAAVLIGYALVSLTVYFLLRLLRLTEFGVYRYWIAPIFLVSFLITTWPGPQDLHDIEFMLFLNVFTLYSLVTYVQRGSWYNLPLLAVVLPLTNPIIALAFIVVLAGLILRELYGQGELLKPQWYRRPRVVASAWVSGLVAACFALSIGAWGYHNWQTMGRFIPSKSNLWYEFYQSNAYDADGILGSNTFVKHHPNENRPERQRYTEQGEISYLDRYRERSAAFLGEQRAVYLKKVRNRLIFAFLWSGGCWNAGDGHVPLTGFSAADSLSLVQAGLVDEKATSTSRNRWLCLDMEADQFAAAVRPLRLEQQAALIQDWQAAKQYLLRDDFRPVGLARAVLYSLIPFVSLLLGLVVPAIRRETLFGATAVLYLIYSVPYLLLAHYPRYQFPLIGLQSVLIFLASAFLLQRVQVLYQKATTRKK